LRECGVEIYSDRKGSYLENRQFEPSELRLLIDSVLGSAHINAVHSKDLIDKLVLAGGKHFKSRIKNIHSVNDWNKTDNLSFFYNIDIIDEAIETNKRIRFYYNKYGTDKKLHHSAQHIVSPYQMLLHNQHYYLFSRNEKWGNIGFYRIDKITEIEILDEPQTPLRENEGYKNGINYKDISSHHPYMFTDKPQQVELRCDIWVIDAILDWFGNDVTVKDNKDGTTNVALRTSVNAMEYWAMQYGKIC
jgi:Predicted transcriptional regulator